MVGYGFMGKMHTYAYKSLPMLYDPPPAAISLVGAAALSESSRELALRQAGYEYATEHWQDLVSNPNIDVINVCVPNHLHRDVLVAAIRAGKHIYCDKPLALDLEQAEEIVRVEAGAEAAGIHRTRQMTQNYRFVPAVMRAKQLIDEGRIGQVYTFCFRYLHSSNIDPNRPIAWRMKKETAGGGALVDLGEHVIDLVRHLIGEVKRVSAHTLTMIPERPDGKGGIAQVDTDDAAFVIAEMANGAVGTLEASKLATGSNDELIIDIRGSKGALLFNLMEPNWLRFFDGTLPDAPLGGDRGFTQIECVQRYPAPAILPGPKCTIGWTRFHIASLYEFVRRVAAGEPGLPSFSDGLEAQRVIEACYRSSGRWTEVAYYLSDVAG